MLLKTNKKGFVVLYTVLIASIILAIAIGISSISFGEIVLSAEAREGNIAFFAADTGAECALYHDRVQGAFGQPNNPIIASSLSCGGVLLISSFTVSSPYKLPLNDNNQCAFITVDKNFIETTTACAAGCTRIESRGYNVPCSEITSNPKTIERAVRVTYTNAVTGGGVGGGGGVIACNNNSICDAGAGENTANCPFDCPGIGVGGSQPL
ncbi:MAG TPA: hypothetical protein VJ103_01305 [Candidatus Paceibacterota bacterium]|nr:hypothetical protein [Candidatus Paceibacterota bacterium]